MKRIIIMLIALIIISVGACQKDEIKPASPAVEDCNKCDGSWDLTDTIP